MKRILSTVLVFILLFGGTTALSACKKDGGGYDYDLTGMSGTVVYSTVSDMVQNPQNYLGKTVKITGNFRVEEASSRNYYSCVIPDATACCSQGIEFVLSDKRSYPSDYPTPGEQITVAGRFGVYTEGGRIWIQLENAKFF